MALGGLGRGRRVLCDFLLASVVLGASVLKATGISRSVAGSRSIVVTGSSFKGITGSKTVVETSSVGGAAGLLVVLGLGCGKSGC